MRSLITLLCTLLHALPALSQSLSYSGRMGERALLVVDGQTRMLGVGQENQGLRLLALSDDRAQVSLNGRSLWLNLGSPTALGGSGDGGRESSSGGRIVLMASSGGHFQVPGSINNQSVNFLIDTGATMVTMSAKVAERLGLDYRKGTPLVTQTANGQAPAWRLSLSSLRVRDVELHQIDAIVVEHDMPVVLLGNSFLSRFAMQREGSQMVLIKR
ncbi:MAG: TIGR02281 family clan AA aspartic protease [Leptothrix ochracea]|uniref:retropepsin-like aspartic protease family protein n=1 Tax=Leptothrix ochracea TaxID=735331 RepID=UPI0034E238E8